MVAVTCGYCKLCFTCVSSACISSLDEWPGFSGKIRVLQPIIVSFFFSHKNVNSVQLNHYRPGETVRSPASWLKLQKLPPYSALEGGKVVSPTHWPSLTSGNIPGSHLCYRLRRLEGHSAFGGIMSMKTSNDPFGNGTCNLPDVAQCLNQLRHQQRATFVICLVPPHVMLQHALGIAVQKSRFAALFIS